MTDLATKMTEAGLTSPMLPENRNDPYPTYAFIRRHEPVHHAPDGTWVLTRYDHSASVLRDPRFSSSPAKLGEDFDWSKESPVRQVGSNLMMFLDPPDHTRLRGLVSQAFTPRRVEELRARIHQLVEDLLDDVVERGDGQIDVLADLAYPLPTVVICELLGVPLDDREQLQGVGRRRLPPARRLPRAGHHAGGDARRDGAVPVHDRPCRRPPPPPRLRPAERPDLRRGVGRPPDPRRAADHRHPAVHRRLRDDDEPHRQRHPRPAAQPRRDGPPPRRPGAPAARARGAHALRRPGPHHRPHRHRRRRDRRRDDPRRRAGRRVAGRGQPRPRAVPRPRPARRLPLAQPPPRRSAAVRTSASARRWPGSRARPPSAPSFAGSRTWSWPPRGPPTATTSSSAASPT